MGKTRDPSLPVCENTIVAETNGGFCGSVICAIKPTGPLQHRAAAQLSVSICLTEPDLLLQMFSHILGPVCCDADAQDCLSMQIVPIPPMHPFNQTLLLRSPLRSTCANSSQTVLTPTRCKLKLHPLDLNPSALTHTHTQVCLSVFVMTSLDFHSFFILLCSLTQSLTLTASRLTQTLIHTLPLDLSFKPKI